MEQANITFRIKNQPQRGQSQKFVGKREQQKNLKEKATKKFVAIVLAASTIAGGVSAIQRMQADANKAQNTKEAIEVANATEHYLENLPNQGRDYDQKINEIYTLSQRYVELANNDNRTVAQEQEYMEVTKKLYCSRNDSIDIRVSLLKTEIAQAYGITDPSQIAAISFEYVNRPDHNNGRYIDYIISVPGKETLNKSQIDGKIQAEIEDIESLSRYSVMPDTDSMTMEQLEAGAKEVYTYYSDIDYEKDYNIKETKGILGIIGKGHLKSVKDVDHNER